MCWRLINLLTIKTFLLSTLEEYKKVFQLKNGVLEKVVRNTWRLLILIPIFTTMIFFTKFVSPSFGIIDSLEVILFTCGKESLILLPRFQCHSIIINGKEDSVLKQQSALPVVQVDVPEPIAQTFIFRSLEIRDIWKILVPSGPVAAIIT